MPATARHTVLGAPLQGSLQPGHEEAFFWHGLFLGRRAQVLADRGRGVDGGGLGRGLDRPSDLRGSVQRRHRPQ